MTRPLALTMGEPAGIGGEIALKAWLRRSERPVPVFFALDDPERLERLARRLEWNVPIRTIAEAAEAGTVFDTALPVMAMPLAVPSIPGRLQPENSRRVIESIDLAVTLVRTGEALAVVTNPINKKALYDAGFTHPGHTEYLAELAQIDVAPIMMLVCTELRVVPVTIHLPLSEAIQALRKEDIVDTATRTAAALSRDFGIARPRLTVAGLNPHAGESGTMGREEIEIIQPAVETLKQTGIAVSGPAPADTLFHERARQTYDAVICMYHDQALIPLKTINFSAGVNVTLGLPFVRTSPDHGTALEIAGTGVADEQSLVAALRTAAVMASNRAMAETQEHARVGSRLA